MVIEKYEKKKNNIYNVYIDGIIYPLYDDIIVKYNLLMNKNVSENDLKNIIKENDKLLSYYESIKYINKKMRSEKEIKEFLKKKNVDEKVIKETIKKLYENKFLNEDSYIKAYINDQINLTNNGENKIRVNLIKLGISEDKINEYLNTFSKDMWYDRITNYVEKKIKLNHTSSSYMLKIKITNDLVNLGYNKEDVASIICKFNIDEKEVYQKEYDKIKKTLEKKYSGDELKRKIKEKLYRKGFKVNSYEE